MTSLAASGRLRGPVIILVVAGVAAGLAAATMVVPFEVVIAGTIAVAGALTVVASPQAGLVAVAVFTVLRIPEVATEFHGAPSLFLPLVVLIALGLLLHRADAAGATWGGVTAAIVVAAFVVAAAVSLLAVPDAVDAVGTLRGIAEDGSVAVLAGLLLRGTASLRRLVWAIVIAGGAVGAVATLQFALGAFDSSFGGFAQWAVQNIVGSTDDVRISGPVGDPNYFAQWMVMIIPLAADRSSDETGRGLRILAAGSALAMAAATVLTFSRGGVLALAVVGAFLLARSPRPMRTVAALAVAAVVIVPLTPGRYLDRLGALGDVGAVEAGIDPSVRARTAEMTAAVAMFSADPLTGVGYGTFAIRYPDAARDLGIDLRATPREAHNLFLQFAAEMGLVGLLLLAGIGVAVVGCIRRGRRHFRRISDLRGDGIGYAVAASLAGYLVTSVFLHLDFARLVWLIVGIGLALPRVAVVEDADREAATMAVTP